MPLSSSYFSSILLSSALLRLASASSQGKGALGKDYVEACISDFCFSLWLGITTFRTLVIPAFTLDRPNDDVWICVMVF